MSEIISTNSVNLPRNEYFVEKESDIAKKKTNTLIGRFVLSGGLLVAGSVMLGLSLTNVIPLQHCSLDILLSAESIALVAGGAIFGIAVRYMQQKPKEIEDTAVFETYSYLKDCDPLEIISQKAKLFNMVAPKGSYFVGGAEQIPFFEYAIKDADGDNKILISRDLCLLGARRIGEKEEYFLVSVFSEGNKLYCESEDVKRKTKSAEDKDFSSGFEDSSKNTGYTVHPVSNEVFIVKEDQDQTTSGFSSDLKESDKGKLHLKCIANKLHSLRSTYRVAEQLTGKKGKPGELQLDDFIALLKQVAPAEYNSPSSFFNATEKMTPSPDNKAEFYITPQKDSLKVEVKCHIQRGEATGSSQRYTASYTINISSDTGVTLDDFNIEKG